MQRSRLQGKRTIHAVEVLIVQLREVHAPLPDEGQEEGLPRIPVQLRPPVGQDKAVAWTAREGLRGCQIERAGALGNGEDVGSGGWWKGGAGGGQRGEEWRRAIRTTDIIQTEKKTSGCRRRTEREMTASRHGLGSDRRPSSSEPPSELAATALLSFRRWPRRSLAKEEAAAEPEVRRAEPRPP